MPCTPLVITADFFINNETYETAPSKSFDGKTLTLNQNGLSVQQGANSVFHSRGLNRNILYRVLGTKFLVILDVPNSQVPDTRFLSVVDFTVTPWEEKPVLQVLAASNVELPVVNRSKGEGNVFLAYGQDGTQQTAVAIYRSDNAEVLCSVGNIIASGQTLAEATGTQLIIHFNTNNTAHDQKCDLPKGKTSVVTFQPQDFGTVNVGGCPFTPPTKQFIIKNAGNDCLAINSIANSPPFSVQTTVPALPTTLKKNETVVVTAVFNPTTPGTFNANLVVSAGDGNTNLQCKGKANAAAFGIQFNATSFNFGNIPVGQPAPGKTLVITNNGSKPLTNVSVPPLNTSGFTCAGFNGNIDCGGHQNIPLAFTPPSEGPQSAVLPVTSDAPGNPHNIQLNGSGCVANAEINVPAIAPIDMGEVEQGFRTVKFITVQNTGDGPLTFNGSISGPDAALFGLPDPNGSVTDAPATRTYSVNPVSACGNLPTGSGKVVVAVSFLAGDAPNAAPRSANLTINGHNATNFPPNQKWIFPLSAVITNPVALDVALVVDHSGSMDDNLGSRKKMDAAVAASQLFVELLRPDLDDRTAVVRFNHLPETVVGMTAVSSSQSPTQTDIRNTVQSGLPPATGNTAIAGGTITGFHEIQKARTTTPPNLRKSVVVLTDGIENTAFEDPPGSNQWFSILGGSQRKPLPSIDTVNTSPISKPQDIHVYCVGVGADADIDTNQLSALCTNPASDVFRVNQDLTGTQFFALEKYFTQIFMDVVGTAPIMDPIYFISPGQTHEIQFEVLRGDVRALVVIYDFQGMRLPFWCLSPKGELIDAAIVPQGFKLRSGFTREARFIEFLMPAKEPERYAGTWVVHIEHAGKVCTGDPITQKGRDKILPGFLPRACKPIRTPVLYGVAIGAGSNFRMQPFVTPNPVFVGDPILLTAMISEAGLPITGCDVTVTATSPSNQVSSLTLLDDGAHSDGAANDGEYAENFRFTYEPGTYHFLFRATGKNRDGQPVVREAVRDKTVLRKGDDGGGGNTGGGGDDKCCRELLRAINNQTKLLEQLLKKKK